MFFEDGVYTVMVTPFTEENKIDYKSYQNLLEKQINNKGVQGLILMGTTSESPTLTEDEKVELVHFTHTFVENQKKIILGVGGNNTDEVIRFGNFCREYCDGMMVTVPNYNKPTQEGIYRHFTRICKEFVEDVYFIYKVLLTSEEMLINKLAIIPKAELPSFYRQKAKRLHPDKISHPQAMEAFQKFSECYRRVSSPC